MYIPCPNQNLPPLRYSVAYDIKESSKIHQFADKSSHGRRKMVGKMEYKPFILTALVASLKSGDEALTRRSVSSIT